MIARNLALSMVLQVPTYKGSHETVTRWAFLGLIDGATADFLREHVNAKIYPWAEFLLPDSKG
jgi:hypothetical protein